MHAGVHVHDCDIVMLNHKLIAAGLEPLPLAEHLMRRRAASEGVRPITPTPYAQILEIPGYAAGESAQRIPGTRRVGGIWIDACGVAQRGS